MACAKRQPKFMRSIRKFGVEDAMVQTRKYGKLFRRKELDFVELNFVNNEYAQLFIEANRNILLDKVLAELKDELKGNA